jgi:hypothetical protein
MLLFVAVIVGLYLAGTALVCLWVGTMDLLMNGEAEWGRAFKRGLGWPVLIFGAGTVKRAGGKL